MAKTESPPLPQPPAARSAPASPLLPATVFSMIPNGSEVREGIHSRMVAAIKRGEPDDAIVADCFQWADKQIDGGWAGAIQRQAERAPQEGDSEAIAGVLRTILAAARKGR